MNTFIILTKLFMNNKTTKITDEIKLTHKLIQEQINVLH